MKTLSSLILAASLLSTPTQGYWYRLTDEEQAKAYIGNVEDRLEQALSINVSYEPLAMNEHTQEDRALKVLKYSLLISTSLVPIYKVTPENVPLQTIVAAGQGDCSDISILTYALFLDMTQEEKNLRSLVRYARGLSKDEQYGYLPHAWIEFQTSSGWKAFETTAYIDSRTSYVLVPDAVEYVADNGVFGRGEYVKFMTLQNDGAKKQIELYTDRIDLAADAHNRLATYEKNNPNWHRDSTVEKKDYTLPTIIFLPKSVADRMGKRK